MNPRTLEAIRAQVQGQERLNREDISYLRGLTTKQRGELVAAACKTAAAIRRSRLEAGLDDIEPAPWPASTWEFMRRHAP